MNLSPNRFIQKLLPPKCEGDAVARRMDVLFGHLDAGMPHGFADFKGTRAGLGKPSSESMSATVQHKIGRQAVLFPRLDVQVANCPSGVVLPFLSGKDPFTVRKQARAQLEHCSSSLSLRKGTAGVWCFASADHHGAVRMYVPLPQRHRFLGPESKIEHQNGDLLQGVLTDGQVKVLQFPIQDKHSVPFTGKRSDPSVLNQPAVIGKDQSLSKRSKLTVDGRRTQLLGEPEVFVTLLGQLVNLIEPQGLKGNVRTEPLDPLFVKQPRFVLLRVLPDVIQELPFEEFTQYRRGLPSGQTDQTKSEIRAQFRNPRLSEFFVFQEGRALMSFAAKAEVISPIFSATKYVGHTGESILLNDSEIRN